MRKFDFYELAAVLASGTVLLLSIGLIHRPAMAFLKPSAITATPLWEADK